MPAKENATEVFFNVFHFRLLLGFGFGQFKTSRSKSPMVLLPVDPAGQGSLVIWPGGFLGFPYWPTMGAK